MALEVQANNKTTEGKPRLELIPFPALVAIAEGLEYGAKEYGEWNFMAGEKWTVYAGAVARHLFKWTFGQDIDEKSGVHHLKLALAGLCILVVYTTHGIGTDDRMGK